MAAKQGLTAQLSQAGEDAKRAVLSRTGVTTSSWFSNLNTVCTIKSAPPRSPEVLQMLATKSGWLFKRNEQHVWQARWCCVVPHTFLYYFDAHIVPGQAPPLQNPSPSQQEEWNDAVQNGLGNRRQHEKRSSLYLFNHQSAATTPAASSSSANHHQQGSQQSYHYGNGNGGVSMNGNGNADSAGNGTGGGIPSGGNVPNGVSGNFDAEVDSSKLFSSMQPAGIIDLECYSSVHRSNLNPLVLELAGDDTVNPDLRGFYFCATQQEDCDDWTNAFLNGRHAALQDECDAYKQVCDGFAQQLQLLHSELDQACTGQEESNDELYRVRSHVEDVRRSCWRLVEDCLEGQTATTNSSSSSNNNNTGHQSSSSLLEGRPSSAASVASSSASAQQQQQREQQHQLSSSSSSHPLHQKRIEYRSNLETIRRQDMSVSAAVQLLCDYAKAVDDVCLKQHQENLALQADLKQTGQSDRQKVRELTAELDTLKQQYERDKFQWHSQIETVTGKYQQSQKDLQDVQKELSSTRMEITMYQSQQRNKVAELQQHKKILKKEVIDLRQKLEDALSELNTLKHQHAGHAMRAEQERQKSELLERYVEKMESQVRVQQNMMEMMSQSGVGSVVHAGSGSLGPFDHPGSHHQHGSINNSYSGGSPPSRNVVLVTTGSSAAGGTEDNTEEDDDDDDVDRDDSQPGRLIPTGDTQREMNATHKYSNSHRRNLVEDMDNKSHVSELTEDRTQRQFEAAFSAAAAAAANRDYSSSQYQPDTTGGGGNTTPSPRMLFSASFQHRQHHHTSATASPSPRGGPPSYIIGVNNNNNNNRKSNSRNNEEDEVEKLRSGRDNGHQGGALGANTDSNTKGQQHHHHPLETIHSSAISLPATGPMTPSPSSYRRIPRSNSNNNRGFGSTDAATTASENNIQSLPQQQRMSVAHRARLEADRQSTPVRIRLNQAKGITGKPSTEGDSQDQSPPRPERRNNGANVTSSSSSVTSQQSSGLWRRMEQAVLGPPPEDMLSSTDEEDTSQSASSRANDFEAHHHVDVDDNADREANERTPLRTTRRRHVAEEKKSAGRSLTLQERSQLQREKQLRFLKEQGLIRDDDDVTGGAGASPQSAGSRPAKRDGDSASVTSSNKSHQNIKSQHSSSSSLVFSPPSKHRDRS